MARYNEIYAGRYNRFIQKLMGMKGSAPAPQLAGDITVAMNLFNGVENRYLEGWERFYMNVGVAAGGAGFNSCLRLRNPTTSNVLAVFEKIAFFGSLVANPAIQSQNPGPATDFATPVALTNENFDSRTRPQPTLIGSSQNNAAFTTGNTIFSGNFLASTTLDVIWTENQEIPLMPNQSLTFREGVLNQSINVVAFWRERFLEESERT